MAAGAATIYRNYFASVDGEIGQMRDRQIDALADTVRHCRRNLAVRCRTLWEMCDGYALCTGEGLDAFSRLLADGDD
jgi:hypothetical protein